MTGARGLPCAPAMACKVSASVSGRRHKTQIQTASTQVLMASSTSFDSLGRLLTSIGAANQTTAYQYDANGNLTSVVSSLPGRGSLYQYNSNGQLTSSTVLNGQNSSFTDECIYDPATHFLSSVVSDPTGLHITTSFEHNNLGLVTRVVDPLGNWMMRFPVEADPARVRRDLERLLRASAFWDKEGRP